jgi:hypothetical protein
MINEKAPSASAEGAFFSAAARVLGRLALYSLDALHGAIIALDHDRAEAV